MLSEFPSPLCIYLFSFVATPDMIRSYFDTGMEASSMDVVVSQDSYVHASTEHHRAVKEAARVLKPGGVFVFSDLMRSDYADEAKLAEVHR